MEYRGGVGQKDKRGITKKGPGRVEFLDYSLFVCFFIFVVREAKWYLRAEVLLSGKLKE